MTSTDHQLRLNQLAAYIRESEQILDAWDTYSDQHSDTDGHPLDETAYGLRQRQRDADTWHAFQHITGFAQHLVDTAQQQLTHLPHTARQPHWTGSITALRDALHGIRDLQAEWRSTLAALPAGAGPGSEEYDEAQAERNAEAWHYLDQWAIHGPVLIDIATATAHPAHARTPAPTPAQPLRPAPTAPESPAASRR